MRLLVCGGRGFEDQTLLEQWCFTLHGSAEGPVTTVIHGGARGADSMAGTWARLTGIPTEVYEADWSMGKFAGIARNIKMLEESRPDLVLAFPHPDWQSSRGTRHMATLAIDAGVKTLVIL